MSSTKLFSFIISILIINQIECQIPGIDGIGNFIPGIGDDQGDSGNGRERNYRGGRNNGQWNIPFLGQCDRIAMRGVLDCSGNLIPNRLFLGENSGGVCW